MYRILLLISLIAIAGWIFWLIRNNRFNKSIIDKNYRSFLTLIRFKDDNLISTVRIISYQLTLILFILLAISAFIPILIDGGHLTGVPLILHVTIAPFFCITLATSALFWAHSQRIHLVDWTNLKSLILKRFLKFDHELSGMQKIYFWIFLLVSVPAILAIILSMYNFFGTEGQEVLIIIHRYATLFLFIIATIHTLGLIVIPEKSNE